MGKHHDRLEQRRVARVDVSPVESGLVGCWQFVAVPRERIPPDPKEAPGTEVGYYSTSLTGDQIREKDLSEVIQGHWSAIENGVHHRREVNFGENRCRVRNRWAEEALAMFRNLAIALYEKDRARGKTSARPMRAWMKRQTFGRRMRC